MPMNPGKERKQPSKAHERARKAIHQTRGMLSELLQRPKLYPRDAIRTRKALKAIRPLLFSSDNLELLRDYSEKLKKFEGRSAIRRDPKLLEEFRDLRSAVDGRVHELSFKEISRNLDALLMELRTADTYRQISGIAKNAGELFSGRKELKAEREEFNELVRQRRSEIGLLKRQELVDRYSSLIKGAKKPEEIAKLIKRFNSYATRHIPPNMRKEFYNTAGKRAGELFRRALDTAKTDERLEREMGRVSQFFNQFPKRSLTYLSLVKYREPLGRQFLKRRSEIRRRVAMNALQRAISGIETSKSAEAITREVLKFERARQDQRYAPFLGINENERVKRASRKKIEEIKRAGDSLARRFERVSLSSLRKGIMRETSLEGLEKAGKRLRRMAETREIRSNKRLKKEVNELAALTENRKREVKTGLLDKMKERLAGLDKISELRGPAKKMIEEFAKEHPQFTGEEIKGLDDFREKRLEELSEEIKRRALREERVEFREPERPRGSILNQRGGELRISGERISWDSFRVAFQSERDEILRKRPEQARMPGTRGDWSPDWRKIDELALINSLKRHELEQAYKKFRAGYKGKNPVEEFLWHYYRPAK